MSDSREVVVGKKERKKAWGYQAKDYESPLFIARVYFGLIMQAVLQSHLFSPPTAPPAAATQSLQDGVSINLSYVIIS